MRSGKTSLIIIITISLILGLSLVNPNNMTLNLNDADSIRITENNVLSSDNVLIWETIGNPDYLDPHVDYEPFGSWISYNVYETLYTYPWDSASTDPTVPLLAASAPVISVDGLNYTISLKQDILFHDGTPFNASCVKWNIERAMKIYYPDGPVWMIAVPLKGGAAVEDVALDWGPSSSQFEIAFDNWVSTSNAIIVMDEYTVRFVLEEPFAPFIQALTYSVGSIMSPSYAIAHASSPSYATWEAYAVDYGEYDNYMSEHMCGTGPYMLTNWLPDQYIQLDLFTDYWRTSSNAYAGSLETVYIKINEDVNGRSLNLKSGVIDGCYWPTTNALDIWDPDTDESLDPNIHVSTGSPTYTVTFFGFNMGAINTTIGTILTSPFVNKDFRHAASWAFDYDTFMDAAVNGFGIKAKGPIPYGMFGYNATSYVYEYDLDQAVAAWNLALQDPDFIESMNELDNTVTFYYNSENTVREMGCLILADGLNAMTEHEDADDQLAAGMNAEMTFTTQALEWSNYLNHIRNRQMPIFFVGWAPDYADPDNYVYPFCYQQGTFAQRIGFNNTLVNEYYLSAKTELDSNLRLQYYNQINDICAEEAPYLWVYQSTDFRTWRTWVHGEGLIHNPMHQIYFYHTYKQDSANVEPITTDTIRPQISNPADITITVGTTGEVIRWVATDANRDSYEIEKDGVIVQSGDWNSSEITYSLDGLAVGHYVFSCTVKDLAGNTKQDDVNVTVTPVQFELNQIIVLSISVASIGVIVVVVVLMFRSRS